MTHGERLDKMEAKLETVEQSIRQLSDSMAEIIGTLEARQPIPEPEETGLPAYIGELGPEPEDPRIVTEAQMIGLATWLKHVYNNGPDGSPEEWLVASMKRIAEILNLELEHPL